MSGLAGKAKGTPSPNWVGRDQTGPSERSPAACHRCSASRSRIASAPSMCMIAAIRPAAMVARNPAASRTMSRVPVRSSASNAAACAKAWGRATSDAIWAGRGSSKGGFSIASIAWSSPNPAGVGIQIAKKPPTMPPACIRGRSRWPVPSPCSQSWSASAPAATTRCRKSLWPSNTGVMAGPCCFVPQDAHRAAPCNGALRERAWGLR